MSLEEEEEDGAAAVAVSSRGHSAGNLAFGKYVRLCCRLQGEPEKSALAVHLQIYIDIHRLERNITSRD
jgi:hypothetical protein